jgi:hypothetical protein
MLGPRRKPLLHAHEVPQRTEKVSGKMRFFHTCSLQRGRIGEKDLHVYEHRRDHRKTENVASAEELFGNLRTGMYCHRGED